jgi:predicted Zn-dependent protease
MGKQERLEMLEKITGAGQADAFAWYALALEYAGLKRVDDALRTFATLRQNHDDYVPMYLLCGTMLVGADRAKEGREWLESGMLQARSKGDSHAMKELEEALGQVPPPPSETGL